MILPCTDCIYRTIRTVGHRDFIGCSDEEKQKGFHYDAFCYHHTCDNYRKQEEDNK